MFANRLQRPRAVAPVLLVLLATLAFAAPAAEVADLYSAEVPAPASAGDATDTALGAALQQVLVKVSGQRDPEQHPELRRSISKAASLVQSYGLVSRPDPLGGPPLSMLAASFDPVEVDGLLRSTGLPVWGRVRPGLLAWVAVQTAGGRTLLGADEVPEAVLVLRTSAIRRGIPLDVPLMDLEDRGRVSADQVWTVDLDALRAASARYGSEALLLGSAEQVLPTLWEIAWTLVLGDEIQQWRTRGDVLELALDDGMGEAADFIAGRFVAFAGESEGVSIRVSGVHTVLDYARTLRYLESLEQVVSLSLEQAELDTLMLRLQARGEAESLLRVIGLGNTLAATGETGGDSFRLRQ